MHKAVRVAAIAALYFIGWVTLAGDAEAAKVKPPIVPTPAQRGQTCRSLQTEIGPLDQSGLQLSFLEPAEVKRVIDDYNAHPPVTHEIWDIVLIVRGLPEGMVGMAFGHDGQICKRALFTAEAWAPIQKIIDGGVRS